ncbi:MAG TPA: GtrA family protein [Firmicutes bacterium]|nr:GtrA family protein [Bacillota bacterium]
MQKGVFMKELLNKYKPLIKQLISYGIIGGISSGLDFCVYVILTHIGINELIANLISVNIGIACSFIFNSIITFKMTDKKLKRGIKFFLVGYCGLGLSTLILFIGTKVFYINEIVVKLISIFIVALFQFILNKLITFRGENKNG